jgi:hypothetical protein
MLAGLGPAPVGPRHKDARIEVENLSAHCRDISQQRNAECPPNKPLVTRSIDSFAVGDDRRAIQVDWNRSFRYQVLRHTSKTVLKGTQVWAEEHTGC